MGLLNKSVHDDMARIRSNHVTSSLFYFLFLWVPLFPCSFKTTNPSYLYLLLPLSIPIRSTLNKFKTFEFDWSENNVVANLRWWSLDVWNRERPSLILRCYSRSRWKCLGQELRFSFGTSCFGSLISLLTSDLFLSMVD